MPSPLNKHLQAQNIQQSQSQRLAETLEPMVALADYLYSSANNGAKLPETRKTILRNALDTFVQVQTRKNPGVTAEMLVSGAMSKDNVKKLMDGKFLNQ